MILRCVCAKTDSINPLLHLIFAHCIGLASQNCLNGTLKYERLDKVVLVPLPRPCTRISFQWKDVIITDESNRHDFAPNA